MVEKVMSLGRVCYKNRGKNSGERVVIVGEAEKNEIIVRERNGKLQKCNIRHLFPLAEVEHVQKASMDEVKKHKENVKEKHRCWRLEYQDDLSFHIDIVPCIPEGNQRRQDIFESLTKSGAEESIARSVSELTVSITDDRNHNYKSIADFRRIAHEG